jgi:hypothetical protein
MQKIKSFKIAISATEKAIILKENKLKQVVDDGILKSSYQELNGMINEHNFQLGYHTERQKIGNLTKTNESKRLCITIKKELSKLIKIKNMDSVKLIEKELDLQDEIEELNKELVILNRMSISSNNFRCGV